MRVSTRRRASPSSGRRRFSQEPPPTIWADRGAALAPAVAGAHRTVRADVDIDGEMLAVAARHIVLRDDKRHAAPASARSFRAAARRLDHHRLGARATAGPRPVLPGHRLRRLDDHREVAGDDDVPRSAPCARSGRCAALVDPAAGPARRSAPCPPVAPPGRARPAPAGCARPDRAEPPAAPADPIRGREDHWRRAVLGFISRSARARRFWMAKSGTCRKPVQWREWREGGLRRVPADHDGCRARPASAPRSDRLQGAGTGQHDGRRLPSGRTGRKSDRGDEA